MISLEISTLNPEMNTIQFNDAVSILERHFLSGMRYLHINRIDIRDFCQEYFKRHIYDQEFDKVKKKLYLYLKVKTLIGTALTLRLIFLDNHSKIKSEALCAHDQENIFPHKQHIIEEITNKKLDNFIIFYNCLLDLDRPGLADILYNYRLTEAIKPHDLKIFDHVIFTNDHFASFRDKKLL